MTYESYASGIAFFNTKLCHPVHGFFCMPAGVADEANNKAKPKERSRLAPKEVRDSRLIEEPNYPHIALEYSGALSAG
jgi:hypothetical protein